MRTIPVTIDVASRATGIPMSTIRRWVSEKRLTSFNHHGLTYVRLTEVEQLKDLRDTRGALPSRSLRRRVP